MEKYRTARRLIILSLVTSLEERQRDWQFTLEFLFPALHGQQPRPLFRVQAPLHGQRTSTDPWSYLTSLRKIMQICYRRNLFQWRTAVSNRLHNSFSYLKLEFETNKKWNNLTHEIYWRGFFFKDMSLLLAELNADQRSVSMEK